MQITVISERKAVEIGMIGQDYLDLHVKKDN